MNSIFNNINLLKSIWFIPRVGICHPRRFRGINLNDKEIIAALGEENKRLKESIEKSQNEIHKNLALLWNTESPYIKGKRDGYEAALKTIDTYMNREGRFYDNT